MRKLKPITVLLALVAVLALGASAASAAKLPQPTLGAWKFGAGGTGGFSLKKSGSKVTMSNFNVLAECEGKSVKATVLGSYPLKAYTRGGYSTWGVGKDEGLGEPVPMAVKVKAGGKTYSGTFDAIFYYEDPARSLLSSFLSFNGCSAEPGGATPK